MSGYFVKTRETLHNWYVDAKKWFKRAFRGAYNDPPVSYYWTGVLTGTIRNSRANLKGEKLGGKISGWFDKVKKWFKNAWNAPIHYIRGIDPYEDEWRDYDFRDRDFRNKVKKAVKKVKKERKVKAITEKAKGKHKARRK